MKFFIPLLFLIAISLTSFNGQAQIYDEDMEVMNLDESPMIEGTLEEDNSQNLVIDNTRTKIGRDFYYVFYRQWSIAATDTSQTRKTSHDVDPTELLITIEELPSMAGGQSNIISISLNDQIVWQQFVQSRYDIIEAYADNAVDVLRQYVAAYEEIQKQLDTQDQMGSGVF